jgi:hypothetical protein
VSHYVIVDGVLQKSSPEASKWLKRVAKEVPRSAPDVQVHEDVQISKIAQRTDWEIIESLEEHE